MAKVLSYQSVMRDVEEGRVFLDFFIYPVLIASIANGITATKTIQIEADSAFILDKISSFASLAGAAQTEATKVVPQINAQLKDSGSGRELFNEPVPVSTFTGSGELPFVLPQPRVFVPNSSINMTFTNFSAAETYTNFYVALIGRKIFKY